MVTKRYHQTALNNQMARQAKTIRKAIVSEEPEGAGDKD